MTAPLILGLGVPELLIILAVVLLLFGGARLAGLGKSTGRALKEFKEETKDLKAGGRGRSHRRPAVRPAASAPQQPDAPQQPTPAATGCNVSDPSTEVRSGLLSRDAPRDS